jgi:hypothetical protein
MRRARPRPSQVLKCFRTVSEGLRSGWERRDSAGNPLGIPPCPSGGQPRACSRSPTQPAPARRAGGGPRRRSPPGILRRPRDRTRRSWDHGRARLAPRRGGSSARGPRRSPLRRRGPPAGGPSSVTRRSPSRSATTTSFPSRPTGPDMCSSAAPRAGYQPTRPVPGHWRHGEPPSGSPRLAVVRSRPRSNASLRARAAGNRSSPPARRYAHISPSTSHPHGAGERVALHVDPAHATLIAGHHAR